MSSWTVEQATRWTRLQGKYLEMKGLQMKFCIYDISLNLYDFLRFIYPLRFQFVRDTIQILSQVKGTLRDVFSILNMKSDLCIYQTTNLQSLNMIDLMVLQIKHCNSYLWQNCESQWHAHLYRLNLNVLFFYYRFLRFIYQVHFLLIEINDKTSLDLQNIIISKTFVL